MDLEIIHNADQKTLTVIRYIRTTAQEFGLGVEITEFVPAGVNQPYYLFDEIVDKDGERLKWFWKATSNCAADPETINNKDFFNSPISPHFEVITKKAFFEELETALPEYTAEELEKMTPEKRSKADGNLVLKSQLLSGLKTLGIGLIN